PIGRFCSAHPAVPLPRLGTWTLMNPPPDHGAAGRPAALTFNCPVVEFRPVDPIPCHWKSTCENVTPCPAPRSMNGDCAGAALPPAPSQTEATMKTTSVLGNHRTRMASSFPWEIQDLEVCLPGPKRGVLQWAMGVTLRVAAARWDSERGRGEEATGALL